MSNDFNFNEDLDSDKNSKRKQEVSSSKLSPREQKAYIKKMKYKKKLKNKQNRFDDY